MLASVKPSVVIAGRTAIAMATAPTTPPTMSPVSHRKLTQHSIINHHNYQYRRLITTVSQKTSPDLQMNWFANFPEQICQG